MKIEYLESCTTNRLTVDGIEIDKIDIIEKSAIIEKIIGKAIEDSKALYNDDGLDSVIRDLLYIYGNMEFDKDACDQCGHTTTTTTMEI